MVNSNPDINKNLLEIEIEMVTPGGAWEIVEPIDIPKENGYKNKVYTINDVDFDTNDKKNVKSELETLLRSANHNKSYAQFGDIFLTLVMIAGTVIVNLMISNSNGRTIDDSQNC